MNAPKSQRAISRDKPSSTCVSRAPLRSSTIVNQPTDNMHLPPRPVNWAGLTIALPSSTRTSGFPAPAL